MGVRSDISTARSRDLSIADGAIFVLSFVYSFWCVGERLVARDEGFYAYAAQLILEGQHPYLDFFYPQMPLLPYFYALGGLFKGVDWVAFRQVSALCFGGILFLTYLIISRSASLILGLIGVVLVGACHLSFAWFPVVQTYSLSVLLLMVGLYLLIREKQGTWTAMGVGLFLALAVQARLFFIPLWIVPLLFYFQFEEKRKLLLSFFAGIFLGSLPSLFFLIVAGESFYFSNLGYHFSRSSRPLEAELAHKWRVFEVLFSLGRPSQKFDGFQTPIIFGALFISLVFGRKLGRASVLATTFGLILFVVSFLPNPTYVQYFCAVVPFSVITTVLLFSYLLKTEAMLVCRVIGMVAILTGAGYLMQVPQDIERYFKSGEGVIGIGSAERAADWNIPQVKKVAETIRQLSREGEEVLSLWPGYLVGSERRALQGAENHFGFRAAEGLSEEEQKQFHVISIAALAHRLRGREVPLVVGYKRSIRDDLKTALKEGRYLKAKQIGSVQFYRLDKIN